MPAKVGICGLSYTKNFIPLDKVNSFTFAENSAATMSGTRLINTSKKIIVLLIAPPIKCVERRTSKVEREGDYTIIESVLQIEGLLAMVYNEHE